MDKLKILPYLNGHRLALPDLYCRGFMFGIQRFLSTEFHKFWMEEKIDSRSFDLDQNHELDTILVHCVQNTHSTTYPRSLSPAAFPRAFLEKYLNKTLMYQHSEDAILQLHIVEFDKEMIILTYSFGTLATLLQNSLKEMGEEHMEERLMKAMGKQLKAMFQVDDDDLARSGFGVE